ncbi:MAG: GNAT family N-acetyltransferase [Chloroflexi bacterium]|nr:GNAT family N-acetyltransferase [Chloroflexota bacterium]
MKPRITADDHDGPVRLHLDLDGATVSELWIIPFTIRIGCAQVCMDGIGGVSTEEPHRNRGYARQMLEEAVRRMRADDAALSMLYGISDFYPRFGYATVGPNHLIVVTELEMIAGLPEGWQARPFEASDLAGVQALHAASQSEAVGAAERAPGTSVWQKLVARAGTDDPAECRVLVDATGKLRAYAWRGKGIWCVDDAQQFAPQSLALAEVAADSPQAADAVLQLCLEWAADVAREEERVIKRLILSLPPEGFIAAAAMRRDADFVQQYVRCGQSMARVLNVPRLLRALKPELERRLAAAVGPFQGRLRIITDIGEGTLKILNGTVGIEMSSQSTGLDDRPGSGWEPILRLEIPQYDLARLALGAYPAGDILARQPTVPDDRTRRLVETLFPLRHPHMGLLDRY